MDFMDFGISDMNKKPFYGNTSMGIFGAEFGNDSTIKTLVSPSGMVSSTSYFGEEESGSMHCSSLMDSNSQESSLIDLKLARLADYKDVNDGKFYKETSVVSPVQPAFVSKKARTTTSSISRTPCCQVYGCNKDLISSKDYHKRHKVCEAHSKTTKVIVNGIEQRFCQQCSSLHIGCFLQVNLFISEEGRHVFPFLPYQEGAKFLRTSISKRAPVVIPNIFQVDILHPERNLYTNLCQQIKSVVNPMHGSRLAIPIANRQLLPSSFFHMHGSGRQHVPGAFSSATDAFDAPSAGHQRLKSSLGFHTQAVLSLFCQLNPRIRLATRQEFK